MIVLRSEALSLAIAVIAVAALPSCRKTSTRVTAPAQEPVAEPSQAEPPQTEPPATVTPQVAASPVVVSPPTAGADELVFEETGWVQVEALRPDVEGGWVTGDFLEARNKIEIKTRGVQQFSLDLSQIRVNWDRLVVIGIDGRNAELRHRDTDLLHVARDESGAWVVLEP